MAFLDVYIGSLDEPLDGDWNGNVPSPLSPLFPHPAPFWAVVRGIESGRYHGKQTDFAGWTAEVTKAEIERLIADSYPDAENSWTSSPHLILEYAALLEFVGGLDATKRYALVAVEL
jgi:hypothetical protein